MDNGFKVPRAEILAFLRDNPGWHTSREVMQGMFSFSGVYPAVVFRRIRDGVNRLKNLGVIMHRVRHANDAPHTTKRHGKGSFEIRTPVYEYRYRLTLDR